MKHHPREREKRIARGAMSVDQILDEYWARVAEEARRSQELCRQILADGYKDLAAPLEPPAAQAEPEDTDDEGVRIYRPSSQASALGGQAETDSPELDDRHHMSEEDLLQEPHGTDEPEEAEAQQDGEDWYEYAHEEERPRPMAVQDILR